MIIKSKNGRNLFQGKFFNWLIEPIYHGQDFPVIYTIWLDDINQLSVSFAFHPDSKMFTIGSYKFLVSNIFEAEKIILSFVDANGSEIPPLFKHINVIRKEKLDEIMNEIPVEDE
jgi:hypothetical protein